MSSAELKSNSKDPLLARSCLDRLGDLLEQITGSGSADYTSPNIPTLIADAIEQANQAFENLEETSPDMIEGYVLYAAVLFEKNKHKPEISCVNDAVKLLREALGSCSQNDTDRVLYCRNLADALREQYQTSKDELCLDEMIKLETELLRLPMPVGPERLNRGLACGKLATSLNMKYKHSESQPLLDQAIKLLREALSVCPKGHPQYDQLHANMVYSLQSIYVRTGDIDRIDEAIDLQRAYLSFLREITVRVDILGRQTPILPERCASLAVSVRMRYERYGNSQILSELIILLREALSFSPTGHSLRAILCEELGRALHGQYTHTRDQRFLDECIDLYREAIEQCPEGHPDKMLYYGNLSNILREHPGTGFLPQALSLQRKAYDLCPKGHQHRASLIENLSLILRQLHELTPDEALLLEANNLQREALTLRKEDELSWEPVCEKLVDTFKLHYEHSGDNYALEKIVTLCHEVMSGLSSHLAWRYASQLTWVHTRKGSSLYDATKARSYLGRILQYNTHTKVSALPTMLDLISHMSESNDTAAEGADEMATQEDLIPIYRGLAQLILGDLYQNLCVAASTNPVVALVNVDEHYRALIFEKSTLQSFIKLDLASWFLQGILEVGNFSSEPHRGIMKKKQLSQLNKQLIWLWFKIAAPVIRSLHIQPAKGYARPRLRWLLTGNFSSLPVHAAGIYRGKISKNICCSDYVVSSYISCTSTSFPPESRALTWPDVRLALAGEPQPAPNLPFLGGIIREIKEIESIALANKVKIAYQSTGSTTVAEVTEAMKEANIFHLACWAELSQKLHGFRLGDGALTIQQLAQLKLKDAFLAFLSACETSKQPEQSMSLADGMLLCGFQNVIATMWEIHDNDGVVISRSFYSKLVTQEIVDGNAVAYALDAAVEELRQSRVSSDRWAPFILMGG